MKSSLPARTVALLLAAWLAFTVQLDLPFFGHHDGSGVWISAAVHNFQRYGAAQLGFLPVINRGAATPDTYQYYVHHPPMIVWITAVMAQLGGLNDLTVRFTAASLMMISVAGVYAAAKRLFNARIAFWAMGFYVLTPMILYYGRSPNHEPLSLLIIAVYAAVLLSWHRAPRRWKLPALISLAVLAGLSSWASMLGVALMTAAGFLTAGSRRWRLVLSGGGLVAGLGLTLALYLHQWSDSLNEILSAFNFRASTYNYYDQVASFTASQWIVRQVNDVVLFLMPALIVLGVLGIRRALRQTDRFGRGMIAALYIAGIGYVLALRNAAYEHDFYKIFLTMPLAITAAVLFTRMVKPPRRLIASLGIALCLASWIGAVIVWGSLQFFGSRAVIAPMVIVHTLDRISTVTTPLYTNLDNLPIGVEYYAFRTVIGGIDANLWNHGTIPVGAIYLDCEEGSPPEQLTGQVIAQDGVCIYVER